MLRLARGGAGLVAVTLALTFAAEAGAARGWRSPLTLGPGALAQVEQDAAGRATAIWLQDGEVRAATRVGGTWSRPVSISAGADSPNLPRLAVSRNGVAVAVWERREGSEFVAQSAVRPSANAAWTPPSDLSDSSQGWPMDVDVAIDSHGNAFAIWSRVENPDRHVESAFRPAATGTWQAPQELGSGTGTRIAMDAAGNAFAVWEDQPANVVQAAVRPASTNFWLPPQTLSGTGYVFLVFPQISVDAAGNAIVAWWRLRGDSVIALETSFRPAATGSWESAQTVATAPAFGYVPGIDNAQVALLPGGNAVAIWQRYQGANWIQTSFRPATSSWSAPRDLSQPFVWDGDTALAVDSAGNALALWSRDADQIKASFRPAVTGDWSLPSSIAGSPGDTWMPAVAFDPDGNAVAVWHRLAPSGAATIESNVFIEAGVAPPPAPAPPAGSCRVPRVVGKKLAAARTAIRKAGCAVGRVRRARSRRASGRVVSQGLRAGRSVRRGTRVNLVVSRGRR